MSSARTGLAAVARGPHARWADTGDTVTSCGRSTLMIDCDPVGREYSPIGSFLRVAFAGSPPTAKFAMHRIGVNRRGMNDSPDVDEDYTDDSLHDVLARVEAGVVTLPLTDETQRMLDSDAFAEIKPGAVLVNAGRGGVIDETAVAKALREQDMKGAAPVTGYVGFAIGRTIWSDALSEHLAGRLDRDAAIAQIAVNYRQMIDTAAGTLNEPSARETV